MEKIKPKDIMNEEAIKMLERIEKGLKEVIVDIRIKSVEIASTIVVHNHDLIPLAKEIEAYIQGKSCKKQCANKLDHDPHI